MVRDAGGDLAAFEELVRRNQGGAWALAWRFLGDAAEAQDIVQEAFLRIYKAAPRYRPTAAFRTYLYRVVARLCLDWKAKKRPEYVATVTRTYRDCLDRLGRGEPYLPHADARRDLVQIYSRGFTGGMYGGRAGRDYVTRGHPDNRGAELGVVVGHDRGWHVVEVSARLAAGDGIALEPPNGSAGQALGATVSAARTLATRDGVVRQAVAASLGGRAAVGASSR